MVLTDLPFQRPDAIGSRYTVLQDSGEGNAQDEEVLKQARSQQYAAFLKEKERQCGPDGFLDSRKFQHTFAIKREKTRDSAQMDRPQSMTAVDLGLKKEREEKEFQHRLKIIEDHMWQHKQEERELKRVEGDIIKNQRAVRRTITEFESTMTRKRLQETKKLNQGLDKYTREQNQHLHKKEEQTKQRIEANISTEMTHKDMGRKLQLTTSHLARQFRSKVSEIELKKAQVDRLNREYEARIKAKEEEQFRLKQELADLAITLNMEAQKGRQLESDFSKDKKKQSVNRIKDDRKRDQDLDNQLGKSDGDTKAAETNRRRLSADLTHTRGHLQVKQREEGRHRQDTEARLRNNIAEQKALNDAAMHADMDLKARQVDQKMADHEARRRALATLAHRQKKEKSEAHESHYSEKFKQRHADMQRREHEDHLKFFQKIVSKGEEKEHNLYNQVRNSEYARQKQEQSVRRMQGKLHELKRKNAEKIKAEMTDLGRQERQLEQNLIREQAALAKHQATRDENHQMLEKHRELLRHDKHNLAESEREHSRLSRIYSNISQSVTLHAVREDSYITLQNHREGVREEVHLLQEHQREHTRLVQVASKSDTLKV